MSFDHQQWRRLPSLKALAAFAAAGDKGNFSRAAEALFLTQGAVSRHIRALEAELGVELFARNGRRVRITPLGQRYLREVDLAFDALSRATGELRGSRAAPTLTVSVLPSVAAKWLSPRLGRFYALHPDVELRINASRALVDFSLGEVDVAIRYGPGGWPDVSAQRLMRDEVFPVCSPRMLAGLRPAERSRLLERAPLLHGDLPETWEQWLSRAAISHQSHEKGLRFNEDLALLQAAAEGLGVALGRSALVERDLKSGVLVQPHPLRLKARYSYWVVTPQRARQPPLVRRFCDWLHSEAARSEDLEAETGVKPSRAAR